MAYVAICLLYLVVFGFVCGRLGHPYHILAFIWPVTIVVHCFVCIVTRIVMGSSQPIIPKAKVFNT